MDIQASVISVGPIKVVVAWKIGCTGAVVRGCICRLRLPLQTRGAKQEVMDEEEDAIFAMLHSDGSTLYAIFIVQANARP